MVERHGRTLLVVLQSGYVGGRSVLGLYELSQQGFDTVLLAGGAQQLNAGIQGSGG